MSCTCYSYMFLCLFISHNLIGGQLPFQRRTLYNSDISSLYILISLVLSLPTINGSVSLGYGVLTLSLKHLNVISCVLVSTDIWCLIAIITYLPDVYGFGILSSPGCITGTVKLITPPAFNIVLPYTNNDKFIFLK